MSDRRLSPKYFIFPAPLVFVRHVTFEGVDYKPGDDLPEGTDKGKAQRLWMSRRIVYKDDFNPTPIQSSPNLDDPFPVTDHKNGSYSIGAPWLDEPITIKGKKKANDQRDKMMREGEPLSHHGVHIVPAKSGAWHTLTADYIEGFDFKVQGIENARFVAEHLREAREDIESHGGIGMVRVDQDKWAIIHPTMEEIEYEVSLGEAEAHVARLREAGPPDGDKEAEDALNAMLDPNSDAAKAAAEKAAAAGGEGAAPEGGEAKPDLTAPLAADDLVTFNEDGHALDGKTGQIQSLDDQSAQVVFGEGDDAVTEIVPLSSLIRKLPDADGDAAAEDEQAGGEEEE